MHAPAAALWLALTCAATPSAPTTSTETPQTPSSNAPAPPDAHVSDDVAAPAAVSAGITTAGATPAGPTPSPPPAPPPWAAQGWGFGGIPAVAYDPDTGLQFGFVLSLFSYDGHTAPYRTKIQTYALVSTKLVQRYVVQVDALNPLDLPVRLGAEVGYYENLSRNYCGVGPDVTCDPAEAAATADDAGVTGEAREKLLRRYYLLPTIQPYALANLRAPLNPAVRGGPELLAGWRGVLFTPGTMFDDDKDGRPDLFPFPNSRYGKDFPQGEPGFLSVFQLGLVADHRDNEPSPRHGWMAEASVRGADPALGSTWAFGGANVTLRGYTPILPGYRKLVLAGRTILDATVGDVPVVNLSSIGGTTNYSGYGGSDLGRGIRGQRYIGAVKLLEQQELRWHAVTVDVAGVDVGIITNAFLDAGLVSLTVEEFLTKPPTHLPIGMGGALLLSFNENFIVRVDVAASSVEGWSPSPYIVLGQSF